MRKDFPFIHHCFDGSGIHIFQRQTYTIRWCYMRIWGIWGCEGVRGVLEGMRWVLEGIYGGYWRVQEGVVGVWLEGARGHGRGMIWPIWFDIHKCSVKMNEIRTLHTCCKCGVCKLTTFIHMEFTTTFDTMCWECVLIESMSLLRGYMLISWWMGWCW